MEALHDARNCGARGIVTSEGREDPLDSARRARYGVVPFRERVSPRRSSPRRASRHPRNAILSSATKGRQKNVRRDTRASEGLRVDAMRVLFLDVHSALATRRYARVADPDASLGRSASRAARILAPAGRFWQRLPRSGARDVNRRLVAERPVATKKKAFFCLPRARGPDPNAPSLCPLPHRTGTRTSWTRASCRTSATSSSARARAWCCAATETTMKGSEPARRKR